MEPDGKADIKKKINELYSSYYDDGRSIFKLESLDPNHQVHPFFCLTNEAYGKFHKLSKTAVKTQLKTAIKFCASFKTALDAIGDAPAQSDNTNFRIRFNDRATNIAPGENVYADAEYEYVRTAYHLALTDIAEFILVRVDDSSTPNRRKAVAVRSCYSPNSLDDERAKTTVVDAFGKCDVKVYNTAFAFTAKDMDFQGAYELWCTPAALNADPIHILDVEVKTPVNTLTLDITYDRLLAIMSTEASKMCRRDEAETHQIVMDAAYQIVLNTVISTDTDGSTSLAHKMIQANRFLHQLFLRRFILLFAMGLDEKQLNSLETMWVKRFDDENNVETWRIVSSFVVIPKLFKAVTSDNLKKKFTEFNYTKVEILSGKLRQRFRSRAQETVKTHLEAMALLLAPWADMTSGPVMTYYFESRKADRKKAATNKDRFLSWEECFKTFAEDDESKPRTGWPFLRSPTPSDKESVEETNNRQNKLRGIQVIMGITNALYSDLTLPLFHAKSYLDKAAKGDRDAMLKLFMLNEWKDTKQVFAPPIKETSVSEDIVDNDDSDEDDSEGVGADNQQKKKKKTFKPSLTPAAFNEQFDLHVSHMGMARLNTEAREAWKYKYSVQAAKTMEAVPDVDERDARISLLVRFAQGLIKFIGDHNVEPTYASWTALLTSLKNRATALKRWKSLIDAIIDNKIDMKEFFTIVATLVWIPAANYTKTPKHTVIANWISNERDDNFGFKSEWTDLRTVKSSATNQVYGKRQLTMIYPMARDLPLFDAQLQDFVPSDLLTGRTSKVVRTFTGMETQINGNNLGYSIPSRLFPTHQKHFENASQHRLAHLNDAFYERTAKPDHAFTADPIIDDSSTARHVAFHMWRMFLLHGYLSLDLIYTTVRPNSTINMETFALRVLGELVDIAVLFGSSRTSNQMTVLLYDVWAAVLSVTKDYVEISSFASTLTKTRGRYSWSTDDVSLDWNSRRSVRRSNTQEENTELSRNIAVQWFGEYDKAFATINAERIEHLWKSIIVDISESTLLIPPLLASNTLKKVMRQFPFVGLNEFANYDLQSIPSDEQWRSRSLVVPKFGSAWNTLINTQDQATLLRGLEISDERITLATMREGNITKTPRAAPKPPAPKPAAKPASRTIDLVSEEEVPNLIPMTDAPPPVDQSAASNTLFFERLNTTYQLVNYDNAFD